MMDILLTLLGAVVYNFLLLLFLVAALIFRRHGTTIFTVGVVIHALAVFGAVQQMLEGTVTVETILGILLSVGVIVGGYRLIGRWQ